MPVSKTRKKQRRAAHQPRPPRPLRPIPPQSEAYLGKLNQYRCLAGHVVVTVDRDAGVTPAFMLCRHIEARGFPVVQVQCDLRSSSAWYRVPLGVGEPSHEWYRPDDDERRTLDSYQAEHVSLGGLLIRRVTAVVANG